MSRPARLVAVALTALAAAASAWSATPLTAAQYKSRVNNACAVFNGHMRTQHDPDTRANSVRFASALIRYARVEVAQIAALTPPRRYRSFHTAILSVQRQEIARAQALLPKLESGKLTFTEFAYDPQLNVAGNKEIALFQAFGARACNEH